MARVLVLGSSNTDLCVRLPKLPSRGETVLGGPFWSGPGGKGANQAVAARRAGAEVVFLTAVGDDAYGRAALAHYRDEGIDASYARVVTGVASGVALIFVGDGGENVIGVAPGANAQLSPDDIGALPESVFDRSGVLLASLEVPWETVAAAFRRARRVGMPTILNPAPMNAALLEPVRTGAAAFPERQGGLLRDVDVLTPNQSEALELAGLTEATEATCAAAAGDFRQRFGIRHVAVTRGADGCVVASDSGSTRVAPHGVEAVDTVGAGDAFNGALAVALAERRPFLEAVRWACAAGALAVTKPGAQAASPYRAEIDRLASSSEEPVA